MTGKSVVGRGGSAGGGGLKSLVAWRRGKHDEVVEGDGEGAGAVEESRGKDLRKGLSEDTRRGERVVNYCF